MTQHIRLRKIDGQRLAWHITSLSEEIEHTNARIQQLIKYFQRVEMKRIRKFEGYNW